MGVIKKVPQTAVSKDEKDSQTQRKTATSEQKTNKQTKNSPPLSPAQRHPSAPGTIVHTSRYYSNEIIKLVQRRAMKKIMTTQIIRSCESVRMRKVITNTGAHRPKSVDIYKHRMKHGSGSTCCRGGEPVGHHEGSIWSPIQELRVKCKTVDGGGNPKPKKTHSPATYFLARRPIGESIALLTKAVPETFD